MIMEHGASAGELVSQREQLEHFQGKKNKKKLKERGVSPLLPNLQEKK